MTRLQKSRKLGNLNLVSYDAKLWDKWDLSPPQPLTFKFPTEYVPQFWDCHRIFQDLRGACTVWAELNDWPQIADFERLLKGVTNSEGVPIEPLLQDRHVSVSKKYGVGYEEALHDYGYLFTRIPSWHDVFNALSWKLYPKTKNALNRRQRMGLKKGRNAEQNFLTLVDEGSVLRFFRNNEEWGLPRVFGHAHYESLMLGTWGSGALHIPIINVDPLDREAVDAWLAERIQSESLKDLCASYKHLTLSHHKESPEPCLQNSTLI